MIKANLLFLLFLFVFIAHAQQDFIILKKRNTTLQTFFSGSYINFQLKNKSWFEGNIKEIRNDSIIINTFQVQYLPTIWGSRIADTIWLGIMRILITDVYALPKKNPSFAYIKNGKFFQYAGAGYVSLNVINGLTNKQIIFSSSNSSKLGAGLIIFLFGKFLQWHYSPDIVVDKKYRLQYINLH